MANAPKHYIAKRGSPRYLAQCKVLAKFFASLVSEDGVERVSTLNSLRRLRANFLSDERVLLSGHSMLLLEHLLQCTRTYTEENSDSDELMYLNRELRWIESELGTTTAKRRRLRRRLHTECHRLDVTTVFRLQLEMAGDIEASWLQQLTDELFSDLAEDILWATEEEINRYIRIAAFRWIVTHRNVLPLCEINTEKLTDVLTKYIIARRSPLERSLASTALVTTIDFEKIKPGDSRWQLAKETVEELLDGEEMGKFDCAWARSFFI